MRAKLSALLVLLAATAHAVTSEDLRAVAFDQHPGAAVSPALRFVDENGRAVHLGDYYQRDPVVLVLGYYECPMLCTVVGNGLVRSLQDLRLDVGRDFTVVHVSIDPAEGPGTAAARERYYLQRYGRAGADRGWHFLTGASDQIAELCETVGFRYRFDPDTGQYAHASGLVILTPHGRISGYLFGVDFPSRALRDALVAARNDDIASPVEKLLLVCAHYLPITGKYGPLILDVLRGFAVVTVGAVVGGALWMSRGRLKEPGEPKECA